MTSALDYLPDLPGVDWEKGTIYYIMCPLTGRMKIGFTSGNVMKRLKALQTGSPTKLSVVAIHPGTTEGERKLHQQFAEFRVHGEWFDVEPELMLHVAETYSLIISLAKHADREPPEWAVKGHEGVMTALRAMVDECGQNEAGETLQ